jgi:hypothetical protein
MNIKLKDYKNEILKFLKEASEEIENSGEPAEQEVAPEETEPTETGEAPAPQEPAAEPQQPAQPEAPAPETPQEPQQPQDGGQSPNMDPKDTEHALKVWEEFRGTYEKLKNAMETAKIGSIKEILENANKEPEGGK